MTTQDSNSAQNSLLTSITSSQVEDIIWEELYREPELFRVGAEYMLAKQKTPHQELEFSKNYPLIARFFEQDLSSCVKNWSEYESYIDHLKNTKLLYASDVFDIFEYCFPFDLKLDRKQRLPLEQIVDRQLAWQWFFDQNDVVLLDQYLLEFRGQKKRIEDTLRSSLVDEFEEICLLLNQKRKELSSLNAVKQLESNLALFLGTLLGFSQSGIDKLANIIENRLLTDYESIISKKGYPEKLTQRFAFNPPGPDTVTLYIDRRTDILDSMRSSNPRDEYMTEEQQRQRNVERFNSLHTDCQVIDRLLNINKSLEESIEAGGRNSRYILLLLSSTDGFERHFASHKLYLEKRPKDVFGRPINTLRNVKQLFLQLLANSNADANPLERFSTYLSYLYVVKARETYHSHRDKFRFTDPSTFRQLTQQLRDSYTNLQVMKHYQRFYSNISTAIESFKQKLSLNELDRLVLDVERYAGDYSKIKSGLNTSNSLLRKLFISYTFQERIEYAIPQLRKEGISINFGETDYVVGIDHHLPTMLSVRNKKYQLILENVIEAILKPIYGKDFRHEFADFLEEIVANSVLSQKEETIKLDPLKMSNSFDDNIVKYLLFLILPSPPQTVYSPETDLLWVITSDIRQLRDQAVPNSQGNHRYDLLKTLQNLRYIKAWTLRRKGEFDESLRIIKIANDTDKIELRGKDPRFFHGAALAHYCIFRQKRENQQQLEESEGRDIASLQKALEAAEVAYNEYQLSGLLQADHHPVTKADIKAFIALVNTLINLKVLLFSYQYRSKENIKIDYELLVDSRNLLNKTLKYFLKEISSSHTDYPEYQHTEAFLEFYEAQQAFDKLDKIVCLEKLESAKIALERYWLLAQIRDAGNQKKQDHSKDLYSKLFTGISELKRKIMV